ncbi:hypothetical protein ACYSUW_14035 [Pseudomonas frederiksbergensis]
MTWQGPGSPEFITLSRELIELGYLHLAQAATAFKATKPVRDQFRRALAAPAGPALEHEESLKAELAWSESDSREQSAQVAALQKQLTELVTLGFNLVGSSGAKRKQHTETFTNRLHELQAELTNSKPVDTHD